MTLLVQAALAVAIVAAAAYGIWEIRRWRTPAGRESLSRRQRGLRIAGLFFLLLVLCLCLRGTFLPTPHTKPALASFLQYWLLTSLLALPLVPLALLDARENLKRAIDERRRLRDEMFSPHVSSLPNSHHE